MTQTVTVEISDEGKVKIETQGFTGVKCRAATQALEAALGHVASDEPTREMYQGATCQLPQQQKASQ